MSSITAAEKIFLENVLDMRDGYVLSFTNPSFGQFFDDYNVAIHSDKYKIYGTSKANKMRVFWDRESDALVGRVLSDMLDVYEAICNSGGRDIDSISLKRSREVVARISGITPQSHTVTSAGFLNQDVDLPSIHKLPVESAVARIIEDRLEEVQACQSVGAHLSVIFQCGSVLEAVLLGAAQNAPEKFNRSSASPKENGKVKRFPEWTLSEFINVSHDIGLLKEDVHKFSHGLRDFRNYIHPYQQMVSGFTPDEHTAKVCFQVLKAAMADVAGER